MTVKRIQRAVITLILLGLTGLTAGADAKLPAEQLYSLFSQANDAFRKANSAAVESGRQSLYEKAILSFEKIINEGQVRNAGLYYNVANAYFLKGELGKAILNYRRAERLDKADENVQKNLGFALSKRVDKVGVKTEKRVLQTLFFWHYDFSIKTKFVLACICFAVFCVGLIFMIWFGRSAPVTLVAVVAALLTVLFFASVVIEQQSEARRICGVITAQEVIAHQADWQDSPPSFKEPLHEGTEFDLIEHRPGWLHIKLSDDSDGWIPEAAAELI
ncbi:MAG TPA: tetratricopeptide repeat protein [Sedimentisphaerales bacterium]|nr:tetratricopeptide repeat protein [Sedimentisphaerales bacterium]